MFPIAAYMRQRNWSAIFRWWVVACPSPSHFLNQSSDLINMTLWNKLQWNHNRNLIFLSEKIRFKISSGKWRRFCHGLDVLTCHRFVFSIQRFWFRESLKFVCGIRKCKTLASTVISIRLVNMFSNNDALSVIGYAGIEYCMLEENHIDGLV